MIRSTVHFLLVLLLGAMLPFLSARAEQIEYVVALVDSGVLLASEFEQFKRIQHFERPDATLTDDAMLDRLITRQIQINHANRRGISVSDSTFNQRIGMLAQNNNMTSQAFLASLSSFPGGIRGFRNYLYDNMLIEQFQLIEVRQQISVSEEDARSFLLTETGQKMSQLLYQVAFIALDTDSLLERLTETTANSVEQQQQMEAQLAENVLFLENEGEFAQLAQEIVVDAPNAEIRELAPLALRQLPGVFSARIPLMRVGNVVQVTRKNKVYLVKLVKVTSNVPTLRDEVRVRQILLQPSILRNRKQTLVEIQSLHERITNGESFASLARTFSEESSSAHKGGDMGWLPLDELDPDIARAVQSLQPAALSQPVEARNGFYLLEVIERATRDISEQTELNQIRKFIFQQKLNDELPRLITRIKHATFIEIRHLQPPSSLQASQ